MRIAIIGVGGIGTALGALFARHEHDVILGSRDPASISDVVRRIGARGAATYREAAADSEVLFFCVPWQYSMEALKELGTLGDRILVDPSNPEAADGRSLAIGHTQSGAEIIAAHLGSARVVKAFNYLYAELLHDQAALVRLNPSIFYCGDDADSKQVVGSLIQSCGLEAIDSGPLRNARYLEPLALFMVQLVRTQGWPPAGAAMRLSHE